MQNNNAKYKEYAQQTINELCNSQKNFHIDTFNYGNFDILSLDNKLFHINGDLSNPIFGVDSECFDSFDERFIFTKTSRRMENDMSTKVALNKERYHNVIIYGHSLNSADYNYFFSIFDKLNLLDASNDSKIIFAFDIYDKDTKEIYLAEKRDNISALFNEYSDYLGVRTQNNRLLDTLTIMGKVFLYEIPFIEE